MGRPVRIALKVVGVLVVLVLLLVGGGYVWAKSTAGHLMTRTYETHQVDFPIPFPLDEKEAAELQAERDEPLTEVDLADLAIERAITRGRHFVEARFACTECHGEDFGGGTMVDDPAIGQLFGPNLTTGKGGRTASFTAADFDRIIRHGVRPDGTPSVMPSVDFFAMSDRELSDIIAYIRSKPPVDREMPPITLGPLGTVLVATGQLQFSAEHLSDHRAEHAVEPPDGSDPLKLGRHLAQTCTGCHRSDLTGGRIPGGPPDWAPAANLTPHESGLAGWTFDDFARVMRTGRKADGSEVLVPMNLAVLLGQKMTEEELAAMWAYVRSLQPLPRGK